MRRVLHGLSPLAGLVLALAAVGCGLGSNRLPESGATLEGTVNYGNEKVMVGLVIAEGDGPAATAFIDDTGHYKLENVPLGEVRLAVNTDAGKGQLRGRAMGQKKDSPPLPKVVDVPAQYAKTGESGIKTTIQRGENTYNIVIPR
jgi:hypothetical protein